MSNSSKKKKYKKPITVGVILGGIFDSYQNLIWEEIIWCANRSNINLITFSLNLFSKLPFSFQAKIKILDSISLLDIDGFLILTSTLSSDLTKENIEYIYNRLSYVPIVSMGINYKNYSSVFIDNKSGMMELMNHLIHDHKYTKLGFIKGFETNIEASIRFNCYLEALKENNIPYMENRVLNEQFITHSNILSNNDPVFKYLQNNKNIDVIICFNDNIALDFLNHLKKIKINVPNSISLTGFDNTNIGKVVAPSLTTVDQPSKSMARQSFYLLLDIINGKIKKKKIELFSKAVYRRSCGCADFIQKQIQSTSQVFKLNKNEFLVNNILKRNMLNYSSEDEIYEWSTILEKKLELAIKKNDIRIFLFELEDKIILSQDKKYTEVRWNLIFAEIINKIKSLNKNNIFFERLIKSGQLLINKLEQNFQEFSNLKLQYELEEQQLLSLYLSHTIDKRKLNNQLKIYLPNLGINSFFIVLYEDNNKSILKIAYDVNNNEIEKFENTIFKSNNLLPKSINLFNKRKSYLIQNLIHTNQKLGHIIIETKLKNTNFLEIYAPLLSNIFQTIKSIEEVTAYSQELEKKVTERTIELKKANKQLKKLDALKNDFIANITHDFRSPLTVIMSITDIALNYSENSTLGQDDCALIYKSAFKLKDSIDKLLDLAKMEAHGIKLKIQNIQINNFLEKIIDYYSSAFKNQKIKIIKELPTKKIDDFFTDTEKLEQIINNLISNAVKFINPDNGIIYIGYKIKEKNILIYIKDNGIGIEKPMQDKIFDRFEQVNQGRNTRYGGTGIGLAFSKQLTLALKGKIWVESEGINKGSTFFINLPRGKEKYKPDEIITDSSAQLNKKTFGNKESINILLQNKEEDKIIEQIINPNNEKEFNPKKGIILIVDDDFTICKIIRKYLEKDGYSNFIITNNAKIALTKIYDIKPQLIISDYNMPIMRGDELHDEIRATPEFSKLPFVFLSAIADEKIMIERRKKGAIAYLNKPINKKELLLTINWHMNNYFEYLKTTRLATIDELTEICNHREIIKRFDETLSMRDYWDLSVFFIDIDYFKEINDTYGHKAGDSILKEVSAILKKNLRDYDISGRYGGDEFLVILPNTNLSHAVQVANKILNDTRSKTINFDNTNISISLSIGISSLKENEYYFSKELKIDNLKSFFEIKHPDETDWKHIKKIKKQLTTLLIQTADKAMYDAKKMKCNSCGYEKNKRFNSEIESCPKCRSKNIIKGRNSFAIFK